MLRNNMFDLYNFVYNPLLNAQIIFNFMRNSRKYNQLQSQEDSLVKELQKRDQEHKVNHLLISQTNHLHNHAQKNHPAIQNHNNFQGFTKANQFFKTSDQQKLEQGQRKDRDQSREKSPNDSTVTVSVNKIKPKDTNLNKQLQASLLPDLQDIGDKCKSCKPPQQGLNYKSRNKKLIQEYQKNRKSIRSQNQSDIEKENSKQKPQNEEKALHKDEENKKMNLNEFKFDENQTKVEKKTPSQKQIFKANMQALDPKSKFIHIIQKSKVESQKILDIKGHKVYFPYQPYDEQVKYMAEVLNSLDNKRHAILESPTGTGKTLCLLSATLSWVQQKFFKSNEEVSIIYLSRTHSQLAQVQKQLQKTCFRPTIAIFGSREIFCIKQELDELKGREKVEACSKGIKLYLKYGRDRAKKELQFDREEKQEDKDQNQDQEKNFEKMGQDERQKVQDAMCNYYSNERVVLELARTKFKNKIITTQKIKELGKAYSFCPYYYPLFVKPICNLFFMPYNYLLDDGLNQKYKEIIHKSILIFDEAHNVPESACEGKSFSITRKTFEDAKKELLKLIKTERMSQQLMMIKMDFDFKLNGIQQAIDKIFNRINAFVAQIDFPTDEITNEEDISLKKIFSEQETEQRFFELLYEKCYDHEQKIFHQPPKNEARRELVKKMAAGIQPQIELLSQLCENLQETPDGIFQNMEKVSTFVKRCIRLMLQNPNSFDWMQREINHYRLMVRKIDKNWDIEVVCLVPFLALKDISDMEPRNIILTSGTLSPIQTWDSELGIEFPIKFSNNHVINPDQLKLHVLVGQAKQSFNFSYKYLQENYKTIYKLTIKAIIDLAQKIPNGILVITPSYKVMNSLQLCLQYNPQLRKRLHATKKCFTQTKVNFDDLIKKYRKAAVQPSGALLFCVCRGKVSEGIDFPNELCRAVIFVGIPFPNVRDIVIKEKKNHYDRITRQEPGQKFSGQKWYQNITFRSVSQAVGRVIRHINDFGAIFLMDLRYNYPNYRGKLPKWALRSYKVGDLDEELIQQMQDFYNEMKRRFGKSEQKIDFTKSDVLSFDPDIDVSKQTHLDLKNVEPHNNKRPSLLNPQKNLGKFTPLTKTTGSNKQNQKINAFEAIMGRNQYINKKKSGGYS